MENALPPRLPANPMTTVPVSPLIINV
jgi:hypothetical protein